MAILDPLSEFKKYSPFEDSGTRLFWGRVIDNRDPKLLNRIKVQIINLLPFENSNELPWFYPKYPIGIGVGPLSGNQSIPEIDSYVIIEFPFNSPYFGFYTGTLSDRLRRLPDLLSEYPERYGYIDSRENKKIVNKAPRVDTTERRWPDASLSINDSRESTYFFKDKYGTQIYLDRKNQYLIIEFAGVKLQLKDSRLNVEITEIHLQVMRLLRILCMSTIHITVKKSMAITGKLFSIMTKRYHSPDESQIEKLPEHEKQGDKG